jgi:hypothetical protein
VRHDILAANCLKGEAAMVRKKILNPERIRSIKGDGFSFIPHRFVTGGFLQRLSGDKLLLYLFLIAVSDRYGLSFYSEESICTLLHMSSENYHSAIKGLIHKDLIAFMSNKTKAIIDRLNISGYNGHILKLNTIAT